jgi:hypothetical protein
MSEENITKPHNFIYEALDFLIKDEQEIMSILQENYDNIVLVPYKINFINEKNAFNSFLMMNNFISEELCFPQLNCSIFNSLIKNDFNLLLSTIKCNLFAINFTTDYENFEKNFDFKGIYVFNQNVYFFIDLMKIKIENNVLIHKNSPFWFVLIDEIVNKKNVCNINIENDVVNFFLNNNTFLYLKNTANELVEIPTVVYTGSHEKTLHFTYLFGKTKDDKNSILGSNYYFTNFKNAVRQGGWSKDYKREYRFNEELTENETGIYNKGGIVRYAIFLGNCLIKQNKPNDEIDNSEMKLYKMDNFVDDYNYEKMTLRISDYDSNWSKNYDSVYLGPIELDDGQILKDTPIFVLKDYENQVPLSYHLIDKRFLGDKFSENKTYEIL